MIKGFKEFVLRGNAIELAVGIVIGAAFGAVVDAVVKGIVDPLVGLILPGDVKNLAGKFVEIGGAKFLWGNVVSQLITFVLTAAAVYFILIVPMNHLAERRARGQETEVEPTNEEKMVALLEQIAAKR